MTAIYEGNLPVVLIDGGIARAHEREVITVTYAEIIDADPRDFERLTRWVPAATDCVRIDVFQVMDPRMDREYEIELRRTVPVITTLAARPAPPAPDFDWRPAWWNPDHLNVYRYLMPWITTPPPTGFYFPGTVS